MKQPKKLTREQKIILSNHGYNANEWAYVEEDEQAILVENKQTKEQEWVSKKRRKR